jgi:hypothetical protein
MSLGTENRTRLIIMEGSFSIALIGSAGARKNEEDVGNEKE